MILNSALIAILGFAFWLVAARFYTAEEVGLASAAVSAIQLLSLFALLGLNFSLIRFLSDSGERSNDLINSSFTIGGLASLVVAVIFLVGVGFWSPALDFIQRNGFYFAGFVVFTLVATMLLLLNHIFIARRRAGFVLSQTIIIGLLKIGLVILLAASLNAFGIVTSWSLAVVIVIILSVIVFLPKVLAGYRPSITLKKRLMGEIFRFSFFNYLSELLWNAPTFILPIIVVNMLGAEQNAYFYIAWAIGRILIASARGVSLSLFAEGSYDEEQLVSNVRRSIKFTLVLLVPAVVVLVLISEKLLLLFGQAYSENGTELLWLMAASALPASVNFIYLSIIRVQDRLRAVVILPAFIMTVTLVMSYMLLPEVGLPGAGIGWLTAHGVAAIVIVADWLRIRLRHR